MTALEYTVPQLAFESHSTELSRVDIYPMFSRLSASQDIVAMSLLKLIEKYRWAYSQCVTQMAALQHHRLGRQQWLQRHRGGPQSHHAHADGVPGLHHRTLSSPLRVRSAPPSVSRRACRCRCRRPTAASFSAAWRVFASRATASTSCIHSPFLSHSFADAIQAGAFLYTAHKEKMTGIGWIYLGTDWNTMQTYAGLSEEFRQPVKEAMEGMVGISPFVSSMDHFVEVFRVGERRKREA